MCAVECVAPHLRCLRAIGFCRLPATSRGTPAVHFAYQIFALLIIITYTVQQLVYAYQKQVDMDKLSEVLFVALCHVTCVAKQLVFLTRSEGVERLVAALNGAGGGAAGGAATELGAARLLEDTARRAAWLQRLFAGSGVVTCVLWIIFPVVRRLRGEQFEFAFWTLVDYEHPAKFCAVLVYSFCCTTLVAVGNTTMDTFIATVLYQCKTQFTVLQLKMEAVPERARRAWRRSGEPHGAALRRLLAECVRHHLQLVGINRQLQDLFGGALLLQFAAAGWILCMSAYRIVTLNIYSVEFASMSMFMSCILTELFLYCYCGNEITEASDRLLGSIYRMEWGRAPVRFQRALLVAMQRAQRPLRPAAGRLVPLSLDTFVKILKSSYSYYAVLRQTK